MAGSTAERRLSFLACRSAIKIISIFDSPFHSPFSHNQVRQKKRRYSSLFIACDSRTKNCFGGLCLVQREFYSSFQFSGNSQPDCDVFLCTAADFQNHF